MTEPPAPRPGQVFLPSPGGGPPAHPPRQGGIRIDPPDPPRSPQVVPTAGTSQARQSQGSPPAVALSLAPPKVVRRAVRNISLDGRVRYRKEASDTPFPGRGRDRPP